MHILSILGDILRDLLLVVGAIAVVLVGLFFVIVNLSHDNPLRRLLTLLSYRLGATAAAGLIAIPIEPIPGLDALYDLGVPVLLIWYWYTFFHKASRTIPEHQRWQPLGQDGRWWRR